MPGSLAVIVAPNKNISQGAGGYLMDIVFAGGGRQLAGVRPTNLELSAGAGGDYRCLSWT